MKLEHRDEIDANVETVFTLVKDKLPELAPYLPSIRAIERIEHKHLNDSKELIVSLWSAKAEMPGLLKRFLAADLLNWKDHATWDSKKLCVSYVLESNLVKSLFDARGFNQFERKSETKTSLYVSCELELNMDVVPGVPRLMKRKIEPLIEKMIEKMMLPNLKSLGTGIKAYLNENSQ